VAVDETNHGSSVGVRSYRSTPYKWQVKKVNADGTYEVTPLTGYEATRADKETDMAYTAWSGFASESRARHSKTVAVPMKRAVAAANKKAEKLKYLADMMHAAIKYGNERRRCTSDSLASASEIVLSLSCLMPEVDPEHACGFSRELLDSYTYKPQRQAEKGRLSTPLLLKHQICKWTLTQPR
jgi:hypothetical protein